MVANSSHLAVFESDGITAAVYLPGGYGCILPEPPVRMSEVAAAVPANMRGTFFREYVAESSNETVPLVLLDELAAFLAGAAVGLEYGQDVTLDLSCAREMHGYCVVLWRLARERGYSHSDELLQVLRVLGDWNNEVLVPLWQEGHGQ